MNGWPFGPRSDHEYDCDRTLKQCRCFVLQEPGVGAKLCPQIKNDVYQFDFSREVDFSGIPSGCLYKDDSVPGVSASLQPPATFCDRFAIKTIDPNHRISPTEVVTCVGRHRWEPVRIERRPTIRNRREMLVGSRRRTPLVSILLSTQFQKGIGPELTGPHP